MSHKASERDRLFQTYGALCLICDCMEQIQVAIEQIDVDLTQDPVDNLRVDFERIESLQQARDYTKSVIDRMMKEERDGKG